MKDPELTKFCNPIFFSLKRFLENKQWDSEIVWNKKICKLIE